MKTQFFLLATLAIFSMSNSAKAQTSPEDISENKEFLLDYFEETTENLEDNIQGLSEEQMSHKPSEKDWSVAQCVEHIIMTEKTLFDMTKALLEKPANPERKAEITATAQQVIDGATDRSNKFNAPQMLQPSGKYKNPKEALADFKAQREQILDYLEEVSLKDLKNHITDTPMGPSDAYQSVLFIAAHTARHTLQIEEVKESAGFPGKK